MDVFRSLYTPGCLVRTYAGRHGRIAAFDARLNIVTVKYGPDGPHQELHFTKLRAGNDETELKVTGAVTKDFPKCGSAIDEQRVLATPDYRRGTVG